MTEINEKDIPSSEVKKIRAKKFLKKLEEALNNAKNGEITLYLGHFKKRRGRKYTISKENLEILLKYKRHLRTNDVAKVNSVYSYVNKLVHFADFVKKPFKDVTKEDIESFIEIYNDYSFNYKLLMKRIIKPFFRWFYGTKEYPPIVSWISCKRKKPEIKEILTLEEIQKLIDACGNQRDRALISVLYESGCRASEFLCIKISDVNFDEYGAVIIVNGKTGTRRVRLISSTASLKEWLNNHPRKNDNLAPLFCSFSSRDYGGFIKPSALNFIINNIVKRSGLKKRVYPHLFRHTRATELAKHLPEAKLRILFGWSRDSKTPSIYIHLSGKDVEADLLRLNGIIPKEDREPPKIETLKCGKCGEPNSVSNKFCWKCYNPLTEEGIKQEELVKMFSKTFLLQLLDRAKDGPVKIEIDRRTIAGLEDVFKKPKKK